MTAFLFALGVLFTEVVGAVLAVVFIAKYGNWR